MKKIIRRENKTKHAIRGDLRFPGLATSNSTLDKFLYDLFGYRAIRDKDDWLVPASDPVLKSGPRETLKLHHQIIIDQDDFDATAVKMLSYLPNTFEPHHSTPKKINVSGELGILTCIDEALNLVALCDRRQLQSAISTKLLPVLCEQLKATHVCAITVDANVQQGAISLAKIAMLLERYPIETARYLSLESDILHHITPHPLTAAEFPACYTMFAPNAVTLPVDRPGCTWHFWRNEGWSFPIASTESMFLRFQGSISPLCSEPIVYILEELSRLDAEDVWSWLRIVVNAINNILRFTNDPLNFLKTDGSIDFSKQIQAMSALSILFSDLQNLNASTRSYGRMKYSFSILDKLGNFRIALGFDHDTENETVKNLLSLSQSKWIRRIIRRTVMDRHHRIGVRLISATKCFVDVQRHLKRELGNRGRYESDRLQRMRSFRNIDHGTFLTKSQFENLFLEGDSSIPAGLPTLAAILSFGLLLDPVGFINFRSIVQRKILP